MSSKITTSERIRKRLREWAAEEKKLASIKKGGIDRRRVDHFIRDISREAENGHWPEAIESAVLLGAFIEKNRASGRGCNGRAGAKSTCKANRDTARLLEAELWSGLEAKGKTRAELYRVIGEHLHVKPRTIRRYLSGK